MAVWTTERTNLVNAITAIFKKTGTGAYQYTQVDTDITSETNVPINQKRRHFRVKLISANLQDMTSGSVIGRYEVELKCYFISAKYDAETFKSEVIAHLGVLLNTYNYNLLKMPEFTEVDNRQVEMKTTLEVGLSYC